MTPELLNLMYERDNLNRKTIKSKDAVLWNQYKKARNKVVHAIRSAQSDYYKLQVGTNSGDKTGMWKSLKHILGTGVPNVAHKITPDAFYDDFTIGAELASKLSDSTYSCELPHSIHEFNLIIIDVDFIYKQINGLKCKSNVDILGIDSKLTLYHLILCFIINFILLHLLDPF